MPPSISCLTENSGCSAPDLCLLISPRMRPSLQCVLLCYRLWRVTDLSCSGPCICLFTLRELSLALFTDIASRQVSPVPLPKGFLSEFLAFVSLPVSGMHTCMLSRFSSLQLFETLWTVAHQAPLSTGFSKQKYWSGLPFSPPGDLPDPEIKPTYLMSPVLTGGYFTTGASYGGFPAAPAPCRSLTQVRGHSHREVFPDNLVFLKFTSIFWSHYVLCGNHNFQFFFFLICQCICLLICLHVYCWIAHVSISSLRSYLSLSVVLNSPIPVT